MYNLKKWVVMHRELIEIFEKVTYNSTSKKILAKGRGIWENGQDSYLSQDF